MHQHQQEGHQREDNVCDQPKESEAFFERRVGGCRQELFVEQSQEGVEKVSDAQKAQEGITKFDRVDIEDQRRERAEILVRRIELSGLLVSFRES